MDLSFISIFYAKSLFYIALLDPVVRKRLYDRIMKPNAVANIYLVGVVAMVLIWAVFLPLNACLHV